MLIKPIKDYKVGGTPHKKGDKPYEVDRNHGEMLIRNKYAKEVQPEVEPVPSRNDLAPKKKQTKK